jgi:DNA-binding MarR family transcriptional regulator
MRCNPVNQQIIEEMREIEATCDRTCRVDGCEQRAKTRGYCHPHYMRWKRNGDPLGGRRRHPGDTQEARVLAFLAQHIKKTGRAPLQREIANHIGNRSCGYAQRLLKNLEAKGLIHKATYEIRGLDIAELGAVPKLAISPVQKRVLEAIRDEIRRGTLPTYKRLAKRLSVKAESTIKRAVDRLEQRGAIRRIPGVIGGIEIIDLQSRQAVLLNREIFTLVRGYAQSQRIGLDTACNDLLRQSLGAAA